MSPVANDHKENTSKCHHCHITAPIPLGELIKTHPLRSNLVKESFDNGSTDLPTMDQSKSEKNESLIQTLIEEVANNKFNLRKNKTSSVRSRVSSSNSRSRSSNENGAFLTTPASETKATSSNSTTPIPSKPLPDKSEPPPPPPPPPPSDFIRPVHSFLHHESEHSIYKKSDNPKIQKEKPKPQTTTTLPETAAKAVVPFKSSSPDLLLNAKAFSAKSKTVSKSASSVRETIVPKVLYFKDSETQTSRASTVTRVSYNTIRRALSSSIVRTSVRKRHKKCNGYICGLPSGLLFAGYGLLIVIGIVVAVALSQRERRIGQNAPAFRRPQIAGARFAPFEETGNFEQRPRPRTASTGVRRVARPAQLAPLPNALPFPLPTPIPAPTPAPTSEPQASQGFVDADFDYLEEIAFDDTDFLLPSQPKAPQPRPQAFKPVEVQPQFRPQTQAPAQVFRTVAQAPPRQQASAPRRESPATIRQEFNLQAQQPEEIRGLKEPEVKIIKSWSNLNADGTFSWGFVNTDGTFKNETKGTDCVVRGIYGYIDEATGETLSFPYESGNPCDPNAPDYYDYDDTGARIVKGSNQPVQRPIGQNLGRQRS